MGGSGRVSRRAAAILVVALVSGWTEAAPAGAVDAAGRTVLVSVSSTGAQGNRGSVEPSLSANGRYVAFVSFADNLVPGDTNGIYGYDVFWRDVVTGRTELVNRSSAGAYGNGDKVENFSPSISADGRYVAFASDATNLVPGDTNGTFDVFVRDVLQGRTRLVSRSRTGTPSDGISLYPSISADGRYVAFESDAANLVPGDTNAFSDIFVRDTLRGQTRLVSRSSTGTQGNSFSGGGTNSSISPDGRYVAFSSAASNLVPGDTNGQYDVFVRDVPRGQTRLVSRSSTGTPGDAESLYPSISADGRYVGFSSPSSNLVPGDVNSTEDVFVRDTLRGRTRLVSRSSTGTQGDGPSYMPSISADGRYVAFWSDATNLAPADTTGNDDVFVRDVLLGRTRLVSRTSAGSSGSSWSEKPSISADGRYVAFYSIASDLVPVDTNGDADVFRRDLRW